MNEGKIEIDINTRIHEILLNYFSAGIVIERDVIHFAESTLGYQDFRYGGTGITPDELTETGLMELILSPETGLKFELESIIPENGLKTPQIDSLVKKLSREISPVSLMLEGRPAFKIKASESLIRRFIRKLHLEKRIILRMPNKTENTDRDFFIELNAILRNNDFSATETRINYLQELVDSGISKSIPGSDIQEIVIFIAELFAIHYTDKSPGRLVADSKQYWLNAIKEIEHYTDRAEKYSTEFMMMQRITPPPVSIDEAEEKLKIISLIESLTRHRTDNER